MDRLTRDQLIEEVGEKNVKLLEAEHCDFDTVLELTEIGVIRFSASIYCCNKEKEEVLIKAYYYQSAESLENHDDLSNLNWEVDHYTINEII